MSEQHKKYVEYIQQMINSVTPYEDNEHLKRLYHLGFMSSLLADIMLDDSKYLDKFRNRIDRLDSKYNYPTNKQTQTKR